LGTGTAAESADAFRKLPPGVFLTKRVDVQSEDREAIGRKLGGRIAELTNAYLRVQGSSIQVNVITAENDSAAEAIHGALAKIKKPPFCLRRGRDVIEYVGQGIDEALARKTSYELGFVPKPARVRWKIEAELATIDRADYMACNPLFNQFLAAAQLTSETGTPEAISSLTRRFQFGRALMLRNPELTTLAGAPAKYQFQSKVLRTEASGSTIRYEFEQQSLPVRHGVPYATATLEVPVGDGGLLQSITKPGSELTSATAHWPVDDPGIRKLAQTITQGKTGADARAKAILEWLTPGRNLKYSGEAGSRWGTLKVLQQHLGHCWDFADCFVTLARAAGVPSREVAGWLYATSGHVWAEYYRDGKGWQQVDPTGGGELPCGIYHIAYFTTEDGEMPIVYLSMPRIEMIGEGEQ
jgi:hypothetical protein